jgi:hypothetical protein
MSIQTYNLFFMNLHRMGHVTASQKGKYSEFSIIRDMHIFVYFVCHTKALHSHSHSMNICHRSYVN